MKKRRALRPALQSLEDRTVMSFSFSNLLHSVFPFIHSDTKTSSKPANSMTPAQRSDLIQKRWDARTTAAAKAPDAAKILPAAHISNAKLHSKPLQMFLDRHQVARPASSPAVK